MTEETSESAMKDQSGEPEVWKPSLAPESWKTPTDTVSSPLPVALKVVGYGSVVFGPLLAIVNLIVVGNSISALEARNAPDGLSTFLVVNIAIFCLLAVLLVIGGIGLIRRNRWGRNWSIAGGIACLLAYLAASIVSQMMVSMLQTGAIPLRPGQTYFYFKEVAGVTGFAPVFGIVMIVLLMLPDSRLWARGGVTQSFSAAGTGAQPAMVLTPAPPTSPLAIASLICSIIPFALLTQIAALIIGIIALSKIKKANGALGGKGFAIAGVIISSLILLFVGGIVVMVLLLHK